MRWAALALLATFPALAGPEGEPANGAGNRAPADDRTLREADQALARAVDERNRVAFEALIGEDAYFFGGGEALRNRAAVLKAWAGFFEAQGPRLRWSPELAEMARSRDVGYTVGRYELERQDSAGRNTRREGRYVTVWRREADGAFRAAADAPLVPPGDNAPTDLRRSPERAIWSRDGDLAVEIGSWRSQGPPALSGLYLAIRRRTREGSMAPALETIVTRSGERE